MRILHIVTLVAADASFGGPAQVALAQAAALKRHGNEVLLIAGGRGFRPGISEVDGAAVKLFGTFAVAPRLGFAGLTSIPMLLWLCRNVWRFDVVHLHLARDLIMIPSALVVLLSGKQFVAQPHGMIIHTGRRLERVLDAIATRRVLRKARTVFVLNKAEGREVEKVAGVPSSVLVNGLTDQPCVSRETPDREVLFLARLHARKQPGTFVKMAIALAPRYPDVAFRLVGPDGGELAAIRALISASGLNDRITIEDPVSPSAVRQRMQAAAVYVLPALDEPFGLTVLEALSVGVPVVISKSGGLAATIESTGSGLTAEDSAESVAACVATLLDDDDLRTAMGARGPQVVRDNFSIEHVCDRLVGAYNAALADSATKRMD